MPLAFIARKHTSFLTPYRALVKGVQPCSTGEDVLELKQNFRLLRSPLVDVTTDEGTHSPEYAKLQADRLSLSENSKQIVAEKSGHFIILDKPDAVIDGIKRVVESVRNRTKL